MPEYEIDAACEPCPGSALYIYESGDGIYACCCGGIDSTDARPDFSGTEAEMYAHVLEHDARGDLEAPKPPRAVSRHWLRAFARLCRLEARQEREAHALGSRGPHCVGDEEHGLARAMHLEQTAAAVERRAG